MEIARLDITFFSPSSLLLPLLITARKRSLRRLCFYRCLSVHGGGGGMRGCSQGVACVVAPTGEGGMRGCSRGEGGMRGCSWGGMHSCSQGGMHGCSGGGHVWLLWGACMVAPGGGMCGCSGGAFMVAPGGHGCSRGACVVAPGGHAWLLLGGMHGCSWGGVCGCSGGGGHAWLLPGGQRVWLLQRGGMCGCSRGGGVRGFFDEIRSMSGRYASYWNAFLFKKCVDFIVIRIMERKCVRHPFCPLFTPSPLAQW